MSALERDPAFAGLLGRPSQCAAIDELLNAVGRAESSTVVLRGEPGIGKTPLRYAAERASGMRVLYATGVEAESDLAFAGLGISRRAHDRRTTMSRPRLRHRHLGDLTVRQPCPDEAGDVQQCIEHASDAAALESCMTGRGQ